MEQAHKKHIPTALVAVGALAVLAFVYLSSRGGSPSSSPTYVTGGPNPQEYAAALQADSQNHASDLAYATSALQASTALKGAALSTYENTIVPEVQAATNEKLGEQQLIAHEYDTQVMGTTALAGFHSQDVIAQYEADAAKTVAQLQANTAAALGQQQEDASKYAASKGAQASIFGSIFKGITSLFGGFDFGSLLNFGGSSARSNLSPYTLASGVGAEPPPWEEVPLPTLQTGPYFGTAFP